jgi:hypothetical protein
MGSEQSEERPMPPAASPLRPALAGATPPHIAGRKTTCKTALASDAGLS